MQRPILPFPLSKVARLTRATVFTLTIFCAGRYCIAQNTPLISGGAGFFTSTKGGNTSYTPIIEPLIDVPIGSRFLIESRAALGDTLSPNGNGYSHSHFIALTYLQGDYFLSRHVTAVAGSFLIPFNTYNDRLSPIWIGNFQDGPIITGIGVMTGTGVGGMLSGSAIDRNKYSISYNAWFSTRSGNMQFNSERAAGGRTSLYLPEKRLEVGLSYDRQLQGTRENFYGAHLWWEPANTAFRLRSEFARGHHAQGYWAEADYRIQAFGGLDSWIGRFEPLFRMQQTFRRDTIVSDNVPLVNTKRTDFGLDYNLPHNTRILTSYSRQFSSSGNENIWETGIVYRFLFPVWKDKSQ
ncbi:MAG: hypothetical protein SA176_05370 [Edaphobacter sp.]|uniref:hypothetical protein n=2 Tax=Acidobacteriaceae TaxID=204434 RepID=UPI0029816AB4|nr:hypothetical protein [Edaphobacter sp.]MDW5265167.1 hypothetical protein [Edaphobacter sp.]